MFKSSESILIGRDRKHVYRIAESYPLFAVFYQSKEILKQNEKEMVVKIGSKILGFPTSWTGHGKKTQFESIEFVQIEGLLKGLVAAWKFRDLGEFTEVTIDSSFNMDVPVLGRLLEWFMGTFKVKKTMALILKALKAEAERVK